MKLMFGNLQKKQDKDDDAERAAFRTYHVLVHMADFEGISMSIVGKYFFECRTMYLLVANVTQNQSPVNQ